MSGSNSIRHTGVVSVIGNGKVDVTIEANCACSGCHAKSVCGASQKEEKVIVVPVFDTTEFMVGDKVEVSIERTMGMQAVLMAYVFPFLLMFATLLILLQTGVSEVISGLSSLAVIAVWYIVLRLMRNRMAKDIIFKAEKIYE